MVEFVGSVTWNGCARFVIKTHTHHSLMHSFLSFSIQTAYLSMRRLLLLLCVLCGYASAVVLTITDRGTLARLCGPYTKSATAICGNGNVTSCGPPATCTCYFGYNDGGNCSTILQSSSTAYSGSLTDTLNATGISLTAAILFSFTVTILTLLFQ